MKTALQVECYSGYKADERPLRFTVGPGAGRTYEVREVVDQWIEPGSRSFKVRADDGNLYHLRHEEAGDVWTLEAFRQGDR